MRVALGMLLAISMWGHAVGQEPAWAKDLIPPYPAQENDAPRREEFFLGQSAFARKDWSQALAWYRIAAEDGDATAQYYVGLIYSEGLGVPKDSEVAFQWFQVAANGGSAPAQAEISALAQSRTIQPNEHCGVNAVVAFIGSMGTAQTRSLGIATAQGVSAAAHACH
jgi:TPR repeat protein